MHRQTIWGVHSLMIIHLETRKIHGNGVLDINVCFRLLWIFDQNIFRVDKYLASYAQCARINGRGSSCNVTKMSKIPNHPFSVWFESRAHFRNL
jgi:hypothetical protein